MLLCNNPSASTQREVTIGSDRWRCSGTCVWRWWDVALRHSPTPSPSERVHLLHAAHYRSGGCYTNRKRIMITRRSGKANRSKGHLRKTTLLSKLFFFSSLSIPLKTTHELLTQHSSPLTVEMSIFGLCMFIYLI